MSGSASVHIKRSPVAEDRAGAGAWSGFLPAMRVPRATLFVAVLHFVTDADRPYSAVAEFRERVSAGSYLAISHITRDETSPEVIATIESVYSHASAPAVFRIKDEIRAFFRGFSLVQPGLVEVSNWRADNRRPKNPPALRSLCGVGRKERTP